MMNKELKNEEKLKHLCDNIIIIKQTKEEKIIKKALDYIQRARYTTDKNNRQSCLLYASGLLEALIIKDDEVKNESKE